LDTDVFQRVCADGRWVTEREYILDPKSSWIEKGGFRKKTQK